MSPQSNNQSSRSRREEEIMQFWRLDNTFQKSLDKHAPNGDFIFYEGPPGVNGAPMLHHFEARAFKDVLPRYKTMRGYRCDRRAGWDCHGLPVELQTEKELGLTAKSQIEEIGIDVYNKHCRSTVGRYTDQWVSFTERMGYWVDYDRAYFTMDNSFIESAWNIIAEADRRGYLYQDYKILPWCSSCGTSLSSHELGQPGAYQDIKELSITAKFRLKDVIPANAESSSRIDRLFAGQNTGSLPVDAIAGLPIYVLAWTTTPWTLPGNVALAVGSEIEYTLAKVDDEVVIVASELLESAFAGKEYSIITVVQGLDLVGLQYEPLFPYMSDLLKEDPLLKNAFQIYDATFVTTSAGTGIVHTAVMYGADDFDLGTAVGLPKIHIVNEDGTYRQGCDFLAGRHVKEKSLDGTETVAVDIIKDLASRGLLWKKEKYEHSYPHCWRCNSPLLYMARSSWYFRMSALREKLLKINNQINWEPNHIKDGRFGEWIDGIKDWAISRSRYWGTPLPVWQTEDGRERVVIGGLADMRKYTVKSGNKYFIMRHGQSEQNLEGTWSVYKDNPHHLTDTGHQQVMSQIARLREAGITKIIASPFVRTRETALIVAREIGIDESSIVYDERLSEFNPGNAFDGVTHSEAFAKWQLLKDKYTDCYEGGETLQNVCKRTGEFMFEIESKYSNEHILIISHMSPLIMITSHSEPMTRTAFDYYVHRDSGAEEVIKNAEVKELEFVPYPHNDNYELDLHKPYIDQVALITREGERLTRTSEVMDVWFDSGCMPLAQDHYPFENSDIYERKQYPADFICEAVDQTRGWFYTLVAVAALIGNDTPFKNVICLGHILDSKGQKMSKSKGNAVDSLDIMNRYSADILRWWMFSVTQPGDSKNFDEATLVEIQNKVFGMLDNCIAFWLPYREYAKANGYIPSEYVLDDWIVTRFRELHANTTAQLDEYKIFEPVRAIRDFIADLSQWYVRRSRERLKTGSESEKVSVATTLKFIFGELAKLMAPFTPFYSESLWQYLYPESDSVHLSSWSEVGVYDVNQLADMAKVREVVSLALEKRASAGIKVRQPLSQLLISTELAYLSQAHLNIIAEELNVKNVSPVNNSPIYDVVLDTVLTQELLHEGDAREIIRSVQEERKRLGLVPSDQVVVIFSEFPEYLNQYKNNITTVVGASEMKIETNIDGTPIALSGGNKIVVVVRH